ncbi:hypothetical protein Tco_0209046, partial [Tanacetum coccineum]
YRLILVIGDMEKGFLNGRGVREKKASGIVGSQSAVKTLVPVPGASNLVPGASNLVLVPGASNLQSFACLIFLYDPRIIWREQECLLSNVRTKMDD